MNINERHKPYYLFKSLVFIGLAGVIFLAATPDLLARAPMNPVDPLTVTITPSQDTVIAKDGSVNISCVPAGQCEPYTYAWTIENATGNPPLNVKAPGSVTFGAQAEGKKNKVKVKVTAPDQSTAEKEISVVVPKAEVTGGGSVTESLDSGNFTCTVTPSGLSPTYAWKADAGTAWPSGAGNSPALNYSAASGQTTKVNKTRWFANPDNRLLSAAGPTCTYQVVCEATINGVKVSGTTSMPVTVKNVGATAGWAKFAGNVQISSRVVTSGTEWYVASQGNFRRVAPTNADITGNDPASSQFYNKVQKHEEEHINQWSSEAPWKDLFNADALYKSKLAGMTDNISEAVLQGWVDMEIRNQTATDQSAAQASRTDAENKANAVSNKISPNYLEAQ